jgi:hypothetical protein
VLDAFIAQHYLNVPIPPSLVASEPVTSASLLKALTLQRALQGNSRPCPREQRRVWLDMAQTNADLQLARLLAEEGSQQARTRALAEALDLAQEDLDALRIECFDISHTAGESTQASCVVFHHHKMQTASTAATTSRASPRRRLRRHAPGAAAPLQQAGEALREQGPSATPAAPRACPIWCWSMAARARSAWRARCLSSWGWTCR